MFHCLITKDSIYRSKRKMDIAFKHVQFRYKDKARYRTATETQMKSLERSNKKVIEV